MNIHLRKLTANPSPLWRSLTGVLILTTANLALSPSSHAQNTTERSIPSLNETGIETQTETQTEIETENQLPAITPTLTPTIPLSSPPLTETPYTLGAGDQLRLDVFDVPEYSGEYQVLIDGTVNLPIIGSVIVRQLTLEQATDVISQGYAPFIRRPLVTLSLLNARALKIAIAGEVNRPGTYTVPADAGQFPSLVDIVELAGGLTNASDLRSVVVERSLPQGKVRYGLDLWELLQEGNLTQDLVLRDGDQITIPTVADIDTTETVLVAKSGLGAQDEEPVNVAVVGQVSRPGSYTVTPGGLNDPATLTKAIQEAGGISPVADIRKITITRLTRTGEKKVIDVDLWLLLQEGDLSQDVILQQGDQIVIPVASDPDPNLFGTNPNLVPNSIGVNVVGEVVNPGAVELQAGTSLNEAIFAAGGFSNTRAKKKAVDLIRLNADGTVTQRRIAINFSDGINEETNPPLRNNDVVIIPRNSFAGVADALSTFFGPVQSFLSIFNAVETFRRPF